jgi:hypothetical protein
VWLQHIRFPVEASNVKSTLGMQRTCFVTPDDDLRRFFEKTVALRADDPRDQLAHRHMIALADHFEGWALDGQATPSEPPRIAERARPAGGIGHLRGPSPGL